LYRKAGYGTAAPYAVYVNSLGSISIINGPAEETEVQYYINRNRRNIDDHVLLKLVELKENQRPTGLLDKELGIKVFKFLPKPSLFLDMGEREILLRARALEPDVKAGLQRSSWVRKVHEENIVKAKKTDTDLHQK